MICFVSGALSIPIVNMTESMFTELAVFRATLTTLRSIQIISELEILLYLQWTNVVQTQQRKS